MINTSEYRDRSLPWIFCGILLLHIILIGWGVMTNRWVVPKNSTEPRRLVVQTINLSPPPAKVAVIEEQVAVAPPTPSKEAAPIVREDQNKPEPKPEAKKAEQKPVPKQAPKVEPKKVESVPAKAKAPPKSKPPAAKAKPSPKPAPAKAPPKKAAQAPPPPKAVKPSAPVAAPVEDPKVVAAAKAERELAEKVAAEKQVEKARQQKLLVEAQERIAKIGRTSDKLTADKGGKAAAPAVPGALTTLNIDALPSNSGTPLTDRERGYRDELAGRLKLQLKLPEYGEVKIKLTLERSGRVVSVVVVSAESQANRKHIEKMLPGLVFPAFGANFGSDPQYTFVITLSNEL